MGFTSLFAHLYKNFKHYYKLLANTQEKSLHKIDYICNKNDMIKKMKSQKRIGIKIFQINSFNIFFIFSRKTVLGILLLSVFNPIISEQPKLVFNAITNDKGLTNNIVYDICQDAKEFMWFATEGGLNRYDGQNIKQYYDQFNKRSLPANSVPCLLFTSQKKLFVGTINGLALYKPETDDFEHLLHNGKAVGEIIAMQQGLDAEILISTENHGPYIFNYVKKEFKSLGFFKERIYGMTFDKEGFYWAFSRFTIYRFDKNYKIIGEYHVSPDLFNSAISYMRSDRKGILWIGTFEKGLFSFDFSTGVFKPFLSSNGVGMYYVRTIEEGENQDEYWVGTEKGLYIINVRTGVFQHYSQSFDENRRTINDNAVYKVFRNKQNVFFIGTYFGGVNIAKTKNIGFSAIYPDDKSGFLHGKALSTIAKAPDGNLWIATEDAGIAILDKSNNTFRHLQINDKKSNTISTNNVHALLMDGNICWVGYFMGGISKINIKTGQTKRFIGDTNNPFSLNNNFVFSIHSLSRDSILVGTVAGMELLDKKTEKFSRFRENELNDCFVYDIFTAPDGKIWICTYNKGIFIFDRKKRGLMTHYQKEGASGLPGNSVISHCVDSHGRIWIGTRGTGLCRFDLKSNTFKTITTEKMLLNNVIYGILEDNKGMLWISSNKGISRLNLSDSTSTHFNYKHGITGNQYNYKSYFKDNDGVMYFGSVTGLTIFTPEDILTPNEKPLVYFSNLKIFNEIIVPNSGRILDKQIDFMDKIKLKFNQNSFTLEFSSINYYESNIAYQYYLEGFDEDWSPLSESKQANYTNISPGHYIFHIRANNKTSNITGSERILEIVVTPPLWASWFAYLIYIILTGGAIYFLYKNYQNRQKEKVALAIERIEKENMNLLHQHKINFFTYISHEFKTPLSVIIASVEMLFQRNEKHSSEVTETQQSIKRSATRLLFLVNQLMEFRKIETDHAVINISKGNMIDFVNQIVEIYRPLVSKKSIDLKVQLSYTETDVLFDYDKLEKILTNLLTNAVKYTPQNSHIGFSMNLSTEFIQFSVKDCGKGLSEVQKEKIFEVFFSEDFSNNMVESSGIGLALTAGLVKLLRGKIAVESSLGEGSVFNVKLPINSQNEIVPIYDKKITSDNIFEIIDITEIKNKDEAKIVSEDKEFSIVIAEDNKDLLMLLYKYFKTKYRVKYFENGKEAWDCIIEKIPDVVITDIMMPVMNGIELCESIKTDINLCHIPVIMLTAKTNIESKMEGLNVGADQYISKPFSMVELELVLTNIIKNRTVLKTRLSEIAKIEGFKIPVSNYEQAFIEKIFALIQENIQESEMDATYLSIKLNISRTGLHNKIKSTMKMSTTEFINMVRINKAKELISITDLTSSEIAFKVGFNDSAYFSRVFKKHTGKTTGEYRRKG